MSKVILLHLDLPDAFDAARQRKVMPFTVFDSRVDRISINPRKQAYEKVRAYKIANATAH